MIINILVIVTYYLLDGRNSVATATGLMVIGSLAVAHRAYQLLEHIITNMLPTIANMLQ